MFKSTQMILQTILIAGFIAFVRTEECGAEELVLCSKPLQVLTETAELTFVTKKEELDILCPDLHAGLHCIRSYTRRCMNMEQRDYFNKLYHGTNEVINELCSEGSYQEDFLRHAPCMRHVKKDYEVCSSRYQNTMSKIAQSNITPDQPDNKTQQEYDEAIKIKTVCCAFQTYISCSEHTVKRACGDETALFTKKFLEKMSDSIMTMHCEGYEPKSRKCLQKVFSSGNKLAINSLKFIAAITVGTFLLWIFQQ